MNLKVPLFKQSSELSCGPTALRMVLSYFGKDINDKKIIRSVGGLKKFGVRTIKLNQFALKLGFKTECLSYNIKIS